MRKPALGAPGAGFCLWYGLWSEYKRNYVNKYYNKKVAIFSKNKAKNCNFFGRSVIIGLGKIQSYQWFASSKQEVFI